VTKSIYQDNHDVNTQQKRWALLWVKAIFASITVLLHIGVVLFFTTATWAIFVLGVDLVLYAYFYRQKLGELRILRPNDDTVLRLTSFGSFTFSVVLYLSLFAIFVGGPLSQKMSLESVKTFPFTAFILVLSSIPLVASFSALIAHFVYLSTKKNPSLSTNVSGS
jgi:hypothetical protein